MSGEPTITSPPRIGAIYWSAYAALEGDHEPLDPLRLDMYAQRLGNVLLPGITNRTERLRYLGMVCAGLQETARGGASVKSKRQGFLPFERGWALAVTMGARGDIKHRPEGQSRPRIKPEFRGLRGANRVLAHWRTVDGQQSVAPTAYKLLSAQESQGGLGAYLVLLRHFGFIHGDTLDLTAHGREIAAAFAASTDRDLRSLHDTGAVRSFKLVTAGEDLTLGASSDGERHLAKAVIFSGSEGIAELVRRMRLALGGDVPSAREGLAAIADASGDRLGRAARFALDFDPLRRDLLALFVALGQQMEGRPGPIALTGISDPPTEELADSVRSRAAVLAQQDTVDGLEVVSALARELWAGTSLADTVRATIGFHRREGRAWILDLGNDRYEVGRHGPFDPPGEHFHGFTVDSALALWDDCEAAA